MPERQLKLSHVEYNINKTEKELGNSVTCLFNTYAELTI